MTQRPPALAHLTSAEAAESASRGDVVLIPLGALEQHGPAMPLGTDTIRAEDICARVAARLSGGVVIAPTLPIGVSPHHLAFPGTVTLTTTTFAAVVREVVLGLHRQGWTRILAVTGHGGNNATLTTVAQDLLGSHPALRFAWTPLTAVVPDVVARAGVSEVHGHCGEAETSQMLFVAPHLVREDLAEPGTTRPDELSDLARLARSTTYPALSLRYDELSANGVLGDPTAASADLGAQIVTTATDRICDFITRWSAI